MTRPEEIKGKADGKPAPETGKAQKPKAKAGGEWGVNNVYVIENGRLCIEIADENNRKITPLANFTARITEEITLIDGLNDSKEFLITGATDTGGGSFPRPESLPKSLIP